MQVCRRNGLPRNVALGLAPATGPQKSPNRTKTPKFQSPKLRKEIQGVQNCAAENPKAWHGDARRTRCQMKVILVETRNLASVFPALDAGQEPCGDAVPTNRRKFYQQEYNHNCAVVGQHIPHVWQPTRSQVFFKHKVKKNIFSHCLP